MNWFLFWLAAIATALVVIEMALRVLYGFGNPPLYIGDEHIGYLLAPNQRVRRFGNLIAINEYSMRAGPLTPSPAPGTLRIFLLGDSLANGNWWTDQADVLSNQIINHLSPHLPISLPQWAQPALPTGRTAATDGQRHEPVARSSARLYEHLEAANASANSWSPRNELAYLDRYGTFGAQVLVLLINTDDLFGTKPTPLPVGRDRNYPNQKPPCAIAEALSRLLRKNQPNDPQLREALEIIHNEPGDRVEKNLAAIAGIHQTITAAGSQMILVLSPLKRELPGPRDYELVARQRLQEWADETSITYLDLLETYRQQPEPQSLYRDHIHLSPKGNELVASAIAQAIVSRLSAQ